MRLGLSSPSQKDSLCVTTGIFTQRTVESAHPTSKTLISPLTTQLKTCWWTNWQKATRLGHQGGQRMTESSSLDTSSKNATPSSKQ